MGLGWAKGYKAAAAALHVAAAAAVMQLERKVQYTEREERD